MCCKGPIWGPARLMGGWVSAQALLKGQLDAQNDRLARASSAAERRRKALHANRPEDAAELERSASLAAAQAANKALLAVRLSDLVAFAASAADNVKGAWQGYLAHFGAGN